MKHDNNISLEDLFAGYTPQLGDNSVFMASITQKLEAVDVVKRIKDAKIRRLRKFVFASFLSGVLIGCSLLAILLSCYDNTQQHSILEQLAPLLLINKENYVLFILSVSILTSFGIAAILISIQEVLDLFPSRQIAKTSKNM